MSRVATESGFVKKRELADTLGVLTMKTSEKYLGLLKEQGKNSSYNFMEKKFKSK